TGSLGLDLATTIDITLIDKQVTCAPTGVKGPLTWKGQPYGALLMGRSSAAIKGLTIIPGFIDADYTGEIKIMLQTHFPPMMFPAGSCIAQLVPLPQLIQEASVGRAPQRGNQGFGSTEGLALLTVPMNTR
ncbi:POK9 protein, partial [Chloroceryle aenea]|nr:POK9 protein [Chloroceryle aenea]